MPVDAPGRAFVPALSLCTVAVALATTLGLPLVSLLADEVGVSPADAQWSLTITLIVGAVATPVLGRMADGGRARAVIAGALLTLAVGCTVTATASGFAQHLVGRALQGVGYGIVPPVVVLLREHLSGRRRDDVIGRLSATVTVGAGIGFPAVALVADRFGTSAAYGAGAVAALLALISLLAVPADRFCVRRASLDVTGAVLLGGGLAVGLLAVTRIPLLGPFAVEVLALAGVSLLLLAVWVLWERRVPEPLMDLRLAMLPSMVRANLAAFLVGVGVFAMLTAAVRLVQAPSGVGPGFGGNAIDAGLALLPMGIGGLAALWVAPLLRERFGVARTTGLAAGFAAWIMLGLTVAHGVPYLLPLGLGLATCGSSVAFSMMPLSVVAAVPADRTASALALNGILRTAGGATGSAVGASLLEAVPMAGPGAPASGGYALALAVAALACAGAAMVMRRPLSPPGSAPVPRVEECLEIVN